MLAACSGGESVAGAEKAITKFHNELNAGSYQQIYDVSDDGFRNASSQSEILKLFQAIHTKLGNFKSGKQDGWRVNYNTAGTNTVVQFQSEYERGKATETFTFVGTANSPRLIGYNINSPALITG